MIHDIMIQSGFGYEVPAATPLQQNAGLNTHQTTQYLPVLSTDTLKTEYHKLQRQIGIRGGVHPLYFENPHWALKKEESPKPLSPHEHDAMSIEERLHDLKEGTHSGPIPMGAMLAAQNYKSATESLS